MNRLLCIVLTLFSINGLVATDLVRPKTVRPDDRGFNLFARPDTPRPGFTAGPLVPGVLTADESSLYIVGESDDDCDFRPSWQDVLQELSSRSCYAQPVVWLSEMSLQKGEISLFKALDGSALFKLALHNGRVLWFQAICFLSAGIMVAPCDDAVAKDAQLIACDLTQYSEYKVNNGLQQLVRYGLSVKPASGK